MTKVKIRAEKLSTYKIWNVYDMGGAQIDFWFRDEDGLKREELIEELHKRGFTDK